MLFPAQMMRTLPRPMAASIATDFVPTLIALGLKFGRGVAAAWRSAFAARFSAFFSAFVSLRVFVIERTRRFRSCVDANWS